MERLDSYSQEELDQIESGIFIDRYLNPIAEVIIITEPILDVKQPVELTEVPIKSDVVEV